MRRTISIELSASVAVEENEVWPDGDAPDEITADAVKLALLACGENKTQVLKDWCLLDALQVTAVVDTWPDDGARTTDAVAVWR